MIQLSFSSSQAWASAPLGQVMDWGAKHGFDAIEIMGRHLKPGAILDDPDEVRRPLRRSGLQIAALAPMLNLLSPEPTVRVANIQRFRLTLQAAAALQVRTVVTYAGSAYGMYFWGLPATHPDDPTHRERDNLYLWTDTFGPLAEEAEALGVRIAFETAPRGGGQGNLAHAPALWEEMFAALPSPALGLSFDPSHLVWLHAGPVEPLLREFSARLFQIDGKDTEIFPERLRRQGILGNDWWRYRLPGDGGLDWRQILTTLQDLGYDGAVSIENEDPVSPGRDGCERALAHLRTCLPPAAV